MQGKTAAGLYTHVEDYTRRTSMDKALERALERCTRDAVVGAGIVEAEAAKSALGTEIGKTSHRSEVYSSKAGGKQRTGKSGMGTPERMDWRSLLAAIELVALNDWRWWLRCARPGELMLGSDGTDYYLRPNEMSINIVMG